MPRKNASYRFLTESALCVALALVFSQIRLFELPQGGSVTLEIVPLILLSMRWGFRRGACAGAAAGALQWVLGGYVVHPVQGILDYPLAFGVLAIAACCPQRAALGVVLAGLARTACHVASGVVFFASYAPEGTHPLIYSLIYNGSFMAANTLAAMILVPLILPKLARVSTAPERNG